jgi:hypothetical protein
MRVATVGITLLFGTAATLMLFNVSHTSDEPCMLRKTEHRLQKEDTDRANAKGKKSILPAKHERPVSQVSSAVNTR